MFWSVFIYFSLSLWIAADVLNSLLEHEVDDDYLTETDAKYEEKQEKTEEDDGVVLPRMSILLDGCTDNHRASTISSTSTASKDSMFSTSKSTPSVTPESYTQSVISVTSEIDGDFEDADDYICPPSIAEKCSPKSKASARLSMHLCRFFIKPRTTRLSSRAKSLKNTESKDLLTVRKKRSNSLPQQVHVQCPELLSSPQNTCFRRRPILSSDEDSKNTTLRVVVFGADHVAGKVARAYDKLREKESACPHLSRVFKLQIYFVPVKKDSAAGSGSPLSTSPVGLTPKGVSTRAR